MINQFFCIDICFLCIHEKTFPLMELVKEHCIHPLERCSMHKDHLC
nr:MAG TPA: hypothetical protein [Caudoviricetes sp.]